MERELTEGLPHTALYQELHISYPSLTKASFQLFTNEEPNHELKQSMNKRPILAFNCSLIKYKMFIHMQYTRQCQLRKRKESLRVLRSQTDPIVRALNIIFPETILEEEFTSQARSTMWS